MGPQQNSAAAQGSHKHQWPSKMSLARGKATDCGLNGLTHVLMCCQRCQYQCWKSTDIMALRCCELPLKMPKA